MKHSKPSISIVGAGPGDPDLLTIKGLRALQSANAVLYDALANPKLLEYAPANAVKVFVGKRAGLHSYNQEEINLLMVQYAYKLGHVVRLKGGDPFVFGRGYEEMNYAKAFDIPVTVVPGISSSIAVPQSQHVPLTHRGLSESFWVVTATTRSANFSKDVNLAAQSSATVIVLMGIGKLAKITSAYRDLGKGDLPVLIVQNGTLPEEKAVVGTIDSIESKAGHAKIGTPGIIVIGRTVSLHPSFIQEVIEVQRTWK
ncbi:MAG: uroporphyrinogen-III C-methyltransferase [Saprospiraceae bacterium]|nr:uroporphyrinogen-III C-methyltransferase [Saprospiraceae bacterium]